MVGDMNDSILWCVCVCVRVVDINSYIRYCANTQQTFPIDIRDNVR